jgi:hypothetical protein
LLQQLATVFWITFLGFAPLMANAQGEVTATIRLKVNLQPTDSFPSSSIAQLAASQCASRLAEKSSDRCDDIIHDRLDTQTLCIEPV